MSIPALARGVPGCTRCARHLRLFSSYSIDGESAQKPSYRPRPAKHRPPPRGPSHRDARLPVDRRHAPSSKPAIRFSYEDGNLTQERRAFDAAGAQAESSSAPQNSVLSSPAEVEDVDGAEQGLTAGRVVEVRRSGSAGLGLILGSILVNGRNRLLLLRPSGEIWPATAQDVQFLFPIDTISPDVAARCWSRNLLASWAKGEEPTAAETPDMLAARRQAVRVMRRITIDTENKVNLLSGGAVREGTVGGAEGVWRALAREKDGTSVTATEAVALILQQQEGEVEPSSAIAYAAHQLLMAHADLFVAEASDMWNDGRFLVRSKEEVKRTERVSHIVAAATSQDQKILSQFCDKVRSAMARYAETSRARLPDAESAPIGLDIEPWTEAERDILHVLSLSLYETRSTQSPPSQYLSTMIAKTVLVSPPEKIDSKAVVDILYAVGVIAPWDSTRASMAIESTVRFAALSGTSAREPDELLKGTELDDLRTDFTGHKVFVIDDPNAEELDDGVSVERIHGSDDVWVHVHIADPTRYLHPGHLVATRASHMGSSLYLPEGGIPLFDLNNIMRDLSLGADIDDGSGAQGVLTVSARISPTGEMQETNVRMGWVKKPRVVTYASVDEALQTSSAVPLKPFGTPAGMSEGDQRKISPVRPEDIDDLKLLRDIASAVRGRRLRKVGFEWANPAVSIRVQSPGLAPTSSIFSMSGIPSQAVLHGPVPETDYSVSLGMSPSQSMIAEFMILAGRIGAKFCDDRSIPVLYRGSARPMVASGPSNEGMTIEQLLARRSTTGSLAQRDIVRAGLYWEAGTQSLRPKPHWIMGFDDTDGYLRLTSPLRRYEDCVVHWQIKEHLAREKGVAVPWTRMSAEEVERVTRRADAGNRRISRLSKSAEAWWQAGIIARHLGSPASEGHQADLNNLEAMTMMSTVLTKGAQTFTAVMIPALGVKAQMFTPKESSYGPGEDVRVRITESAQWPNALIKCEQVK